MTSSTPQALPAEPSSSTIPAQPSNPAPEWIRPPDFDARMARVTASVPYDAATFPTLSRAEQIAFYSAMMEAVRREFPDMPVGQVEPKGEDGGWVEMVVDFGGVVKGLDEETGKKLNEITRRMFAEAFEEGVVEEVRGEVGALLGGRYPGVLETMEEMIFKRKDGCGKIREYINKEVEAGRGNPFSKCAGGVCKVPGKGGVEEGE